MIADVHSAPVVACVEAANLKAVTLGATFFTVAGAPSKVNEFIAEAAEKKVWVVAAQAEIDGVKTATLRGPLELPYREIGGLTFSAQSKRLAVTFTTFPAICEVENNAQKN